MAAGERAKLEALRASMVARLGVADSCQREHLLAGIDWVDERLALAAHSTQEG